jgi:guanylate kinase
MSKNEFIEVNKYNDNYYGTSLSELQRLNELGKVHFLLLMF